MFKDLIDWYISEYMEPTISKCNTRKYNFWNVPANVIAHSSLSFLDGIMTRHHETL